MPLSRQFGANKVFELESPESSFERHQVSQMATRSLFEEGVTYNEFVNNKAVKLRVQGWQAFDLNEFNALLSAILPGLSMAVISV